MVAAGTSTTMALLDDNITKVRNRTRLWPPVVVVDPPVRHRGGNRTINKTTIELRICRANIKNLHIQIYSLLMGYETYEHAVRDAAVHSALTAALAAAAAAAEAHEAKKDFHEKILETKKVPQAELQAFQLKISVFKRKLNDANEALVRVLTILPIPVTKNPVAAPSPNLALLATNFDKVKNGIRLWPANAGIPGTCPNSICRQVPLTADAKKAVRRTAGKLGICRKHIDYLHLNMNFLLVGYKLGKSAATDAAVSDALNEALAAAAAAEDVHVAKRDLHKKILHANGQLAQAELNVFFGKMEEFDRCMKTAKEALDRAIG